jgi:hypothetical protein
LPPSESCRFEEDVRGVHSCTPIRCSGMRVGELVAARLYPGHGCARLPANFRFSSPPVFSPSR